MLEDVACILDCQRYDSDKYYAIEIRPYLRTVARSKEYLYAVSKQRIVINYFCLLLLLLLSEIIECDC